VNDARDLVLADDARDAFAVGDFAIDHDDVAQALVAQQHPRAPRIIAHVESHGPLAPPLAQDRIRLRSDGRVLVQLKTVWSDGTSHFLIELSEFLEKLAAIIPRPAVNVLL
jgi:hypothetical protein